MIKVENLSQSQVFLKFKDGKGSGYTKTLNSGSVLKLSPEQFQTMEKVPSKIAQSLRISKYNIVGSLPGKVELHNPTPSRVIVQFVRSPVDKYSKTILPARCLTVTESEFALIKNVSPLLTVIQAKKEHKTFVRPAESTKQQVFGDVSAGEIAKLAPIEDAATKAILDANEKPIGERLGITPALDINKENENMTVREARELTREAEEKENEEQVAKEDAARESSKPTPNDFQQAQAEEEQVVEADSFREQEEITSENFGDKLIESANQALDFAKGDLELKTETINTKKKDKKKNKKDKKNKKNRR